MSNHKKQPLLPKLKIRHPKRLPNEPKLPPFHDEKKLERILEQRKYQRQMLELVSPSLDDAVHSVSSVLLNSTKEDLLHHYKTCNQPTNLREKALKGISTIDQVQYRRKELQKLDEKVQTINERSPLDLQWKPPFLQEPVISFRQPIPDNAFSQQVLDPADQRELLLNENFKGFGHKLRSYLDYDKHKLRNLKREEQIILLKKHRSSYLDMVKMWNVLQLQDQLKVSKLNYEQPFQATSGKLKQFGTVSSISQYQSIQDFHRKMAQIPKVPSQQQTPASQLPQFVVRNSRQSNSSTNQFDFGIKAGEGEPEQVIEFDEELEATKNEDNDIFVHRDTFLVYCSVFWDLIRKEDEIVERVVQALCPDDRFTFNAFKLFYRLFVFQNASLEEYIKFIFMFFSCGRDSIQFTEVQGLLRLLTMRVDERASNTLCDQILLDIVNKIHRPQQIQKDILWQLIHEDQIPATIILRLIYEH